MTNSLSKARKRFFARDPDVRRYAAADTAYDDDEYVPEYTEDERADAERRKVSLISIFVPLQLPKVHPLPPIHSQPPMATSSHTCTQRDIPPGLSESDAAILHSVKRRASVLDKHFKFCGAHFGWTFVVGMLPFLFPLPPPPPTPAHACTLMSSAVL